MSNALSDVSFWFDALDALPLAATPPLPVQVDVAIAVGGRRPESGGCRRAVNKSERENVYHHETLRPR